LETFTHLPLQQFCEEVHWQTLPSLLICPGCVDAPQPAAQSPNTKNRSALLICVTLP